MSTARPAPADPAEGLGRAQIRDLLAKGWLTHDGMWFDQTARARGLEEANRLNLAAIGAMAPFEVARLAEALGVNAADLGDAEAVVRFVEAGVALVAPESVSSRLHLWAEAGCLRWEWEPGECFAYKGMQRFGHLAGYECGVIYRVECWLEALGVRPPGERAVRGCLMYRTGRCDGELPLSFGD